MRIVCAANPPDKLYLAAKTKTAAAPYGTAAVKCRPEWL
jgi:hypothetical protein